MEAIVYTLCTTCDIYAAVPCICCLPGVACYGLMIARPLCCYILQALGPPSLIPARGAKERLEHLSFSRFRHVKCLKSAAGWPVAPILAPSKMAKPCKLYEMGGCTKGFGKGFVSWP